MSAHDADLTLKQIAEICDRAVEFRTSMTWEEFRGDWRRQMLGERLVEVLGEAVKRLPEDLRARHPQLPWKKSPARGITSRMVTTAWTMM
jgi:uncharacterized protein with HEPN domain